MKICVFGAGAIGGLIAARLASVGCDVSVVARGPHLAAIQKCGLSLVSEKKTQTYPIRATANAAELGPQDYVIVAVKTSGLAAAVPSIGALLGPDTTVVPAMNGVPWWFFSGFGAQLEGARLEELDPGGKVAAGIDQSRVLGCVVYPSANIAAPGVVEHTGRWDLYLGEPDGKRSERAQVLAELLNHAGFSCQLTERIRREIWTKLVGNASFNPVSALTRATLDRMLADRQVYALLETLMTEVIAVGNALGLDISESPRLRLERGRPLGAVKFSMLQDIEQGRPLEFEALSGAVLAIAARLGVATPALGGVHGMVRVLARMCIGQESVHGQ